jgi:hypothetical protein
VPIGAAPGTYRFVVTANRYGLTSAPFKVSPSSNLTTRIVGIAHHRARVRARLPAARRRE